MKKIALFICCFLLLLASCNSKEEDNIVQTEEDTKQEVSIIPSYSLSEDQYKMVLPYRPSEARDTITNQVTNRVDIDELEEGLRRHSTDLFDPDKYVFEEGQYLDKEFIYSLIDDLNPDPKVKHSDDEKTQEKKNRDHPRIFSHILEQNFLKRNKDNTVDLAGVSIGIALKSVYRFDTKTKGPYYEEISEKEMLTYGKEIAEDVLKDIREVEGLENVPIMIGLFREEAQSSPVPGNFVTKTTVKKGESTIDSWQSINEEHILFPSDEAQEEYNEDYQKVKAFGDEIADYFPNYVGVSGDGFYINDDLTRLTLKVPIEFYGKGEVIGFTQFVYKQLKEIFPNRYDLELMITSSEGPESLIYRKAGAKEPKVHIYH